MKLPLVFLGVLAVMLTGCLGGIVDAAHQAAANRIGAVSVLGDDAQIDADACAHAVDRLRAAHPGSVVVNLQAERGSVRFHVPQRAGLFDNGEIVAQNNEIATAAHGLAVRHHLDLVVVIAPSVGVNSGAGQPPNDPGCGVWTPSLFGAHIGGGTVYANFSVQAYDGKTGQRLSIKIASVHQMTDYGSLALRGIVLKGLDEQLAHMHLTPNE